MTTENPLARIALDYSRTRAKQNTWCETEAFDGIFIRYMEAASVEWTGELRVRYRKHNPGATFLRPIDSSLSTWLTESVLVHPDRARVDFVLGGCPEIIARGLFLEV
jgi:hypothetical protein